MTNLRRVVLLTITIAAPVFLLADCLAFRSQSVELDVHSCRASTRYAAESLSCMKEVFWFQHMQSRIVAEHRGIVLTGEITTAREIPDGYTTLSGPDIVGLVGDWVVRTDEEPAAACASLLSRANPQFVFQPSCCDVIPAGDFACWFGIEELTILPEGDSRR